MRQLLIISLTLLALAGTAQSDKEKSNPYKLKFPAGNTYDSKCTECVQLIDNRPREVEFAFVRDSTNTIFFYISRKDFLAQMIDKKSDGLTIDIVSKDRYQCGKEPENNGLMRGAVQEPIYKKDIFAKLKTLNDGGAYFEYGKVPSEFLDKEIELNMVALRGKTVCYYSGYNNIKSARWELLDMGMYMDSTGLTYKDQLDTTIKISKEQISFLEHKRAKFEILFQKNKYDYTAEELRPIYDSLELKDYIIKKIQVRAYASVEGNTDKNIELQQKRAESIATAIRSFQTQPIDLEIQSEENWIDFYADLNKSPYIRISELPRDNIKTILEKHNVADALEPYLKRHRRAEVILELERTTTQEKVKSEILVDDFKKTLQKNDLSQAYLLQKAIFQKIKNGQATTSILDQLEIPKQSGYSLLLSKSIAFRYLANDQEVYTLYKQLLELKDLTPKDPHVRYNLCVLKFKLWLLGELSVNPDEFKAEINELKKYKVPDNLLKRMMMNYNIVMCEYQMKKGDFAGKDKSLKAISTGYNGMDMRWTDYLSLAQYFSSYSKYDWSIKLLRSKIKEPNAEADLLFYYINLGVTDEKIRKGSEYKALLKKASEEYPERYCNLFKSNDRGGISFQLLEDKNMRESFCNHCGN